MHPTHYHSNSSWRTEAPGHPTVVTLFNEKGGMEMAVDASNTCQQWCPPSSTYYNPIKVGDGKNGTSVAKQIAANTWSWTDNLLVIAMDHKELTFASDGVTPSVLNEQFTPFGKLIGNGTSTYTNFKASADPTKFEVVGIDNCQMSPNCQQGIDSMRISPLSTMLMKEFQ